MDVRCIPCSTLPMNVACAPHYLEVEVYNEIVYRRTIVEIPGHIKITMISYK